MDLRVQSVIDEYHVRMKRETAVMSVLSMEEMEERKNSMLIAIGPETAQFLTNLIKGYAAQTIVELGASYGYSTVWFADAARATGGRVISFELDASKVEYIRGRLEQAGLSEYVEFRIGDATNLLADWNTAIDFVLIDLWKDLYIPCFDLVLPRLTPGAFIAADNMLQPPAYRPMGDLYRRHVHAAGRFDSVLLPIGSGIELSRLRE
jgi:predicted O-methyltransferase YrrM